jgi:hypothetical protein
MPAPTNPIDFGQVGHRAGLYFIYPSLTAAWIDRLQSIDPSWSANTTQYYELGNFDPVGYGSDPTEFNLSFAQNVVATESDFLMAGKNPAVATSFNMGDIINASGSLAGYLVMRKNPNTNPTSVYALTNMTTTELTYSFVIKQPCTFTPRIMASIGRWYTAAGIASLPAAVATWGTPDTASAGAIRGRDARITFGNLTSQAFRLQSFNIKATFPVQKVEELGTRAMVGLLAEPPEITVDYDILLADDQPHDQWATLTSNYYDFNNLTGGSTVYITLYSPTATEATTPVQSWRVDNLVAATATPIKAQVRGLSTVKYSLKVSKAQVAGSGGLTVFKGAATVA